MKKLIVAVILMTASLATSNVWAATQLSWRITDPRIIYTTNNYTGLDEQCLEFDVQIKADVSGTRFWALSIILDVDVTAVDILDFTGNASFYNTSNYTVSVTQLSSHLNVFLTSNKSLYSTNTSLFSLVPTTWTSVGTLRLNIIDKTLTPNIDYVKSLWDVAGNQDEKLFASPWHQNYAIPSLFDSKNLTNIYLGRIYSNTTKSYGWSQYGGSTWNVQYMDWSIAENTSVWDTSTTAATITNTGSKANALRIHPGARLKITVGNDLTCTGNTEINEPRGLWIESTASGNGSFIDNGTITYPTSGSARVERFLGACDVNLPAEGCWHYVSSPVSGALSGVFTGDYMQSWNEVTHSWSGYITSVTLPLNVMEGYAVSRPSVNTATKLFTGDLNTACSAKVLTFTAGTYQGFNLIGNPYPSAIDVDAGSIVWTNVDHIVWYYDKVGKTYLAYPQQLPGGAGSRYIPSMQGVFVHANAASPSITFPNTSRVHSLASFYKELQAPNDIDVLYLKAQGNGKESYDLASVVLRDYASGNYENNYDALKMYGGLDSPQLYTVTNDNAYLTINSLPYAGRNTTVPLNFKVFENGTGSYTLTASNLESFRSGTTITLEDKKETKMQELTVNPVYTFNYTDGDNDARFLLHFFNPFFGINEQGRANDMLIYSYGQDVYVKDFSGNPEKGDFYLYDMMGQKLAYKQLADISLNKYTFNLPDGYYIVRVITKDKTYNGKVYLD